MRAVSRGLAAVVLLVACAGEAPSAMDAGVTAPEDVFDERRALARPPSPIDPRLFDCRAQGVPQRVSVVPAGCGIDPACRTPQIIGHRGAGGQLGYIAPEDTLAAYRAAIALGIEFTETDPRPTADGVLVNMHDSTVDRTTTGTGTVSQMTFAQVRALTLRTDGYAGEYSCERVPTLTEILRLCRGRIVVVVDANKTDRVDLLVGAIREADAFDWSVFSTSDMDKLERALTMEPRIRGHIRPRSVPEITAQLDRLGAARHPVIVELQRSDVREGALIVHARGSRVAADIFGEDVFVGTSGDIGLYGRAFDEGADIVQTDRPAQVLELLRRRGVRR